MSEIVEKEPLSPGLYALAGSQIAAIVTYLEMKSPPAATTPAGSGLSFARVRSAAASPYAALWRRVGEPWGWFSRLEWSDERLAAHLDDQVIEAFIVHDGDQPIGLVELDTSNGHETELAFFGVVPERIGTGAGRAMIAFAITTAFKAPITRLFVHTCTLDHPAALHFYQRAGFIPYHRAIEIAYDPRAAGLLPDSACPHYPRLQA